MPSDSIPRHAQARFWMKHVDNKLHPSCGAVQWPLVMLPGLLKKSEAERQALLDQVPEKPRRERQKRLAQYGLRCSRRGRWGEDVYEDDSGYGSRAEPACLDRGR